MLGVGALDESCLLLVKSNLTDRPLSLSLSVALSLSLTEVSIT